MLLATVMSNTFTRIWDDLKLDPSHYISAPAFSFRCCKRLMNFQMQTIPNSRVFNAVVAMKSFSEIKKQVSLASVLNDHVQNCKFSKDCPKCSPFVKSLEGEETVRAVLEETKNSVVQCESSLKKNLTNMKEDEIKQWRQKDGDNVLMRESIENATRDYKNLKDWNGHG